MKKEKKSFKSYTSRQAKIVICTEALLQKKM